MADDGRLGWEFYIDDQDEFRWRAKDLNGQILFVSAEGYKRATDAEQCATRAGYVDGVSRRVNIFKIPKEVLDGSDR